MSRPLKVVSGFSYVKTTYRKVASNRRSWLVAIIRVSIKGKFDVYVQ